MGDNNRIDGLSWFGLLMSKDGNGNRQQPGQASLQERVQLGTDVAIAAAVVLLEIAAADQAFNKFSRSMVFTCVKDLFNLSEQSANAVVNEAKNHLRNMRGSSSEAFLLRDVLDPTTKRALADVMDNIIRSDGNVEGIEIYLRQRFRSILGLPEKPLFTEQPPEKT